MGARSGCAVHAAHALNCTPWRRWLQVVCRWLGIDGGEVNAGTVDVPKEYGLVPVWIQELKCKGTEASVADCPTTPADPQAASCTYFRAICTPPGEACCAAGSAQWPVVAAAAAAAARLCSRHQG